MYAKIVFATLSCSLLAVAANAADNASSQLGKPKTSRVSRPAMSSVVLPTDAKSGPVFMQSYSRDCALAIAVNPLTGQIERKDSPVPGMAITLVFNPKDRKMEKPFMASKPGHAVAGAYDEKAEKVQYFESSKEGLGIAAVYNPEAKAVEKRESKAPGHSVVGYYDHVKKMVIWKESPEKGQIGVVDPLTKKIMWKKTDMEGHGIAGVFATSVNK